MPSSWNIVAICWPVNTVTTFRLGARDASRTFYLQFGKSVYAIPLRPGEIMPPIPSSGFRSEGEVAAIRGARRIADVGAFPGPTPSMYAFIRIATQRNIYRVPVP